MSQRLTIDGHTLEQILDDEAAIDRWHAGWEARSRGLPCPKEPTASEGWHAAESAHRVQPVAIERPEGYWHMPLGTFE